MSSVNKAIVVGHLGADPELRYTQSNTPVCNLSVATSERYTDKQGEQQEQTEWHRIVVFGRQAENCNEYLSKGRLVYVEGRIQTRKWEDNDGNTRYSTEIVARSVQFLSGGDGGRSYDSGPSFNQSRGGGSGSSSGGSGGSGGGFDQSFDDDDIPF